MSERETGGLPYLVAMRQIVIVYPFHFEYDMDNNERGYVNVIPVSRAITTSRCTLSR